MIGLSVTIPAGGYRWVDARPVDRCGLAHGSVERFLVTRGTAAGVPQSRTYDPAEVEPLLFRKFAALPPNPDSLRAFANQFGGLGTAVPFRPAGKYGRAASDRDPLPRGEPLSGWRDHRGAMEIAVNLWDACRDGDRGRIARLLATHENALRARPPRPEGGPKPTGDPEAAIIGHSQAASDADPTAWPGPDRVITGDLILPGLLVVQDLVNHRLRFPAAPGLFWDYGGHCPEAGVRPPRLVDFLWWQLAQAISRSVSFRPCQTCGRLIRIGQGTRADRFYCSHACRLRGYRQRKPLARALAAKGKTVEEIAAELGADPAVVMRWVSD